MAASYITQKRLPMRSGRPFPAPAACSQRQLLFNYSFVATKILANILRSLFIIIIFGLSAAGSSRFSFSAEAGDAAWVHEQRPSPLLLPVVDAFVFRSLKITL